MNYLTEEQMEGARKFAENVPIDELFNQIRKLTNISGLTFSNKIVENGINKITIYFKSEDIVNEVGFLNLIFSTLVIDGESRSTRITYDENRECFIYSGTAYMSYEHQGGGSNGKDFMYFKYTEQNGWEFDVIRDR